MVIGLNNNYSRKQNMLKAPPDETLTIKTTRLILEPILVSHAEEMLEVLSFPELQF